MQKYKSLSSDLRQVQRIEIYNLPCNEAVFISYDRRRPPLVYLTSDVGDKLHFKCNYEKISCVVHLLSLNIEDLIKFGEKK